MPLLICLQSGANSLAYVCKITRTTQNISSQITYSYIVRRKPTCTKRIKHIQYQHRSIRKMEQININTLYKRRRLFSRHLIWEDAPPRHLFRHRKRSYLREPLLYEIEPDTSFTRKWKKIIRILGHKGVAAVKSTEKYLGTWAPCKGQEGGHRSHEGSLFV